MASSARSRQSATASRQSRGPTQLPIYQPPIHPLNEKGRRALEYIPRSHNLDGLKERLQTASTALQNNAADINERYQSKADFHHKRRARKAQQGVEDEDEEAERVVEEMREKVQDLTAKMEEGVRRIIDAQATVEAMETALAEVHSNVVAGGGAVAPTQSTLGASQFRPRRRRRGGEIDEEDSEFEDEGSQRGDQENAGPSGLLKRKLEEHATKYENLSLRTRYATHNDYVGFKRLIHDVTHPGDDAPPMPHASTWFPSEPSYTNNPGPNTRNAVNHLAAPDSDSDIEVASERISIQCPITLRPMKDPVTSKKCPHSFEKSAILEMISNSAMRVGGSNRRGAQDGEQAMQCPLCDMILTPSTLTPDPVLLRKITRIQALQTKRAMHGSDSDSSDPGSDTDTRARAASPRGTQRRRAEEIFGDSGDEEEAGGGGTGSGMRRAMQQGPRVKAERMGVRSSLVGGGVGGGVGGEREVSFVPGTQVGGDGIGIGTGNEREGEEEGEGNDERQAPPPSSSSNAVVVDLEDEDDDDDDDE